MNIQDIHPLSILYIIVCFLIIYFVAKNTVFKKLDAILKDRHEKIEGSREAAAEYESTVDSTLHEVNLKLDEARTQAFSTRQRLRSDAMEHQKSILEQARINADQKVTEAQEKLEVAVGDARNELENESENLAKEIVTTVLR